ncbi:Retrovirus-related Pol polyprotein from transposon opu [Taenia solium]|eukprot:TsM_001211700 transcript=TsM_001211700 gene=TsM_001211700
MPRNTQPSNSRGGRRKEVEREESPTLVAALTDLPHFKKGINFVDWIKAVRFNIHLYPQWQRIPLILLALPQELFIAAINAGVIDYCCETLSKLAIDQREESLTKEFLHRNQKAGKNDEEYARNLRHPAERAFRGSPPNRVTNWMAVQFRAKVRPPTIAMKLHAVKTNDLIQLVEAAIRKRQELLLTPTSWTSHCRPNPLCPLWDVILGADFPRNTKAVQNSTGGTFLTQQFKETNSVASPSKKDADEICSALFEAASIPINNLDELCAPLMHITDSGGSKYPKMFSWQGAKIGRKNILKHGINTGEPSPLWQPPRCLPLPHLEEVNRPVDEVVKDEVTNPSKSPWASPIALAKKSDNYRKLNTIAKKDVFSSPHINDLLDSLHGSNWPSTLDFKLGY